MNAEWNNLQETERRLHQSLQDAGRLIPFTIEGVEQMESQLNEAELDLPPGLRNPSDLLTTIKASQNETNSNRKPFVFGRLICLLRKEKGYSVSDLAEKARVDEQELRLIEAEMEWQPKPRTVAQLAGVFGVRPKSFARVANLTRQVDEEIAEGAVRFAACAKDMDMLTPEQSRALKEFVRLLNSMQ